MFRTAASSVIGLLVEDGRLALGAVAALVITWLAAGALGDAVGWLLLALILVLVVANVLAVGVRLRRPA